MAGAYDRNPEQSGGWSADPMIFRSVTMQQINLVVLQKTVKPTHGREVIALPHTKWNDVNSLLPRVMC